MARDAGFEVVLINQGGLAKGLYTHEDVAEIHVFERGGEKRHPSRHFLQLTNFYRTPLTSLEPHGGRAEHSSTPRSWMVGDKQRDLDAVSPWSSGRAHRAQRTLLDAVKHIVGETRVASGAYLQRDDWTHLWWMGRWCEAELWPATGVPLATASSSRALYVGPRPFPVSRTAPAPPSRPTA